MSTVSMLRSTGLDICKILMTVLQLVPTKGRNLVSGFLWLDRSKPDTFGSSVVSSHEIKDLATKLRWDAIEKEMAI